MNAIEAKLDALDARQGLGGAQRNPEEDGARVNEAAARIEALEAERDRLQKVVDEDDMDSIVVGAEMRRLLSERDEAIAHLEALRSVGVGLGRDTREFLERVKRSS